MSLKITLGIFSEPQILSVTKDRFYDLQMYLNVISFVKVKIFYLYIKQIHFRKNNEFT